MEGKHCSFVNFANRIIKSLFQSLQMNDKATCHKFKLYVLNREWF